MRPDNLSVELRALSPGGTNYVDFEGQGEQLSASSSDLRIINQRHSSEELQAEDVEIFERYVANDQLMRRPLRFTKAALERFAESFREGRTVLLDHDERRPIGHTFAADVVKARVRGISANWLRVKFYAVTKGASEQRLQDIQDVKTGVRKYDSIEARGGKWTYMEEKISGETVGFYEVDDAPDLEAGELSIVYLGAVKGAGSDKGLGLSARDRSAEPADPYAGLYADAPYEPPATELAADLDPNDPYAGLYTSADHKSRKEDPGDPYAGLYE